MIHKLASACPRFFRQARARTQSHFGGSNRHHVVACSLLTEPTTGEFRYEEEGSWIRPNPNSSWT